MVAILDPRLPQIYVLDSLGGREKDRREAKLFGDCLMRKRKDDCKDAFEVIVPNVPEQPNFEDCGLFAIQYVKEVVNNPDRFRLLCTSRDLSEWFNINKVRYLRSELAELVISLAKEQRKVNGVLEGRDLRIPDIDFLKVNIKRNAISAKNI